MRLSFQEDRGRPQRGWFCELAAAGRVARVGISVPLLALEAEPGPGGSRARLRIIMAVRQAGRLTGRPVDIREKWVEVAVPSPAPDGEFRHEFVVEVTLAPGEQDVAVGVQDAASQKATFRRMRLPL